MTGTACTVCAVSSALTLICMLLNVHHVLSYQAVHLKDVGVVLRENSCSVYTIAARLLAALELAEPLKGAP